MTSVVLDASALIALLRAETGSEVVRRVLPGSLISTVNYSEVLKKAIERDANGHTTAALIRNLPITIIPFVDRHAELAAELYTKTKSKGSRLRIVPASRWL